MDRMLDLDSGMIHEKNKPVPGMWRFPTYIDLCCIYRVPNSLRQSRGDITNTKSMDYLNMEEHKKIYLAEFEKSVQGKKTIDSFRRMIEEDEDMIRASYSESTAWIESPEFVEMIMHDAVFILELMLRRDLILLENQLPYFILEKLFDPILSLLRYQTFHELTIQHFEFQGKKGSDSKFRHFTDLTRCVRVVTVPEHAFGRFKPMYQLYNADKLYSRGVKFKVVENPLSVLVTFDKGVLKIPYFVADDDAEITIRNIMALEQCPYPFNAHVCNYIMFLDYLIDTGKDVDLLVEKDIITNCIGDNGAVAKMERLFDVERDSHYRRYVAIAADSYSDHDFDHSD
ncbi:hypothetical protein EUTSA_v10003109mg [Eutrema salsugineum]|uniref:Uncharacterized protein n=1 Tax=Eutrema salsugineum TaxID=72664 RepID=V4MY58_EUTSA|nr:hypothetical protein EUTSA_v10003109mg [Eutrema salsugineum]